MKAEYASIWFVPCLVVATAFVAFACGPNEPDPSTPANSPVPTHLDRPSDPAGSPKSSDAG